MSDIKGIRLANLKTLLDEAGSVSALANQADTDPNYISQILSARNKASLGSGLARRIEAAFRKPEGWMDNTHITDRSSTYGTPRKDILRQIASDLKGEYAEEWEEATAEEAAFLLKMLFKVHGGLNEGIATTSRKPKGEAE